MLGFMDLVGGEADDAKIVLVGRAGSGKTAIATSLSGFGKSISSASPGLQVYTSGHRLCREVLIPLLCFLYSKPMGVFI